MSRRLIAGLACRLTGSRLYGKPLQAVAPGVTILSQIVASIRAADVPAEVVLAIAESEENAALRIAAVDLGTPYVLGDEKDVLGRLIAAAEAHGATDLLRKTTESPFFEVDGMELAWERHVANENDITVVDHVPLGTAVEIYTVDALRRSHAEGRDEDRSELVSNYGRFNQRLFKVELVKPQDACRRTDLRLTVDYPEDLILCRAVYEELGESAPLIPLAEIVAFLDRRPDLTQLVAKFVHDAPLWDGAPQRDAG
jgi:spore coat polysaccharide biosynthesis protein SpsF (cytidylyltransferase family)